MTKIKKITVVSTLLASTVAVSSTPAHAAVSPETAYILNSFLFIFGGVLVMWMAAGFAMLESGLVRSKNVATICLKNISLFAIAGIMYYLMGYNLMYMDVSGFIGSLAVWAPSDVTVLTGAEGEAIYSSTSDWFFQMVFVATAASVVSGTLAERIKLWPFLAFVVVLTGVIYPIQGAWTWGGGFLSASGFVDFAGSSIVHGVGGWAALVGAIILGPRLGRFDANGASRPIPGSSMPLATLGTFILWFGWFGFNGASQLAMGTIGDVNAIAAVSANTSMAAAGGVVSAMLLSQLRYGKVDLSMALNGALAGLVSITADPLSPSIGTAILIGGAGSVIASYAVTMLDKFQIDDVVGAIPVHLIAGIWGTLAVAITNPEATFVTQFIGVASIGSFVTITSAITWFSLKVTVGIRLSEEEERVGTDLTDLGMEAYPEFGRGSQKLF